MRKLLVVGYVAIAIASLWLRSAVPVWAIVGPHDDFLFVRLAYYLGAGLWLGPFDNLTLAKGMGYPAFILAAFVAGIPLKIAEQLAYLAAAGLAAWLLFQVTGRRWLAFVLFTLLAFNPILLRPEFARVIREGLYISLSLAVVMLAGLVVLQRKASTSSSGIVRALLLVTLGLMGALFWLTREEGPWLVPPLIVLLASAVIIAWRERTAVGALSSRTVTVMRVGAAGILALAAFAVTLGAVAAMNYRHYGVSVLTEFQAGRFLAAYGSLLRIRHENWQPRILFPTDARRKAYAVSAAARELLPALDGPLGEAWRQTSCREVGIDPCSDIYGAWMMWAVRDAVAQAGHYESARDALRFYDRIAQEIGEACNDGRLACNSAGVSIFPPFRWHYLMDVLAQMPTLARILLAFGDGVVGTRPNVGSEHYLAYMADLVGPIASFRSGRIALQGRIIIKGELPQVSVHDSSGQPHTSSVKWLPPHPVQPPPGRPIEIDSDCTRSTCELVIQTSTARQTMALATAAQHQMIAAPDFEFAIDFVRSSAPVSALPATEKRRNLQLSIARGIARVYVAAMPFLVALALVGVLIALVVRPADLAFSRVMALALTCAAAVASRAVLLGYHEVAALPGAINVLYLSPATPFLLLFVTLGLYLGGQSIFAMYIGVVSRRRSARLTH